VVQPAGKILIVEKLVASSVPVRQNREPLTATHFGTAFYYFGQEGFLGLSVAF